ncbi:MAG: hypothetical protein IBJ00_00725 [Alphaproteobacteria bacterium]|nr:hypothetical protein [Alphaproteobacteria bacterium]
MLGLKMKKFICYSLLSLLYCTSIFATETLEDQIQTLQNLCVQKIKGEIVQDSSFVIRWLERSENNNKYDHEAIIPLFRLATEKEDIPFFRLKKDNKEIYILGSQHTVPIYKCLTLKTVAELKRIALLQPIFYSEHESSNEEALRQLNDPANQIESK